MEIEGIVFSLLPPVSGTSARGEWRKQEIIIEQSGEFNRKVCVSFWGDKALDASELKPSEKVRVSINLESREYNGRWYTEARAWKLEKLDTASVGAAPPFDTAPPFEASSGPVAEDGFDDLPF